MKTLFSNPSGSLLRVFTACLLSFAIFIVPFTQVAAAGLRSPAPAKSEAKHSSKVSPADASLFVNQPVALTAPQPAPLAPVITASKVDSLVNDDGDGKIDPTNGVPGTTEKILYNVTVSNTGSDVATGVHFTDFIDSHTSLVGGSLNVSPLAGDDSYETIANTLLEVGPVASPSTSPKVTVTGSVLDNDVDFPNSPAPTLKTPYPTSSANGGIVAMESDGHFSFTPKEGSTATDTFTYTITDQGADGIAGNADDLTSTATVTITVKSPKIWYVNNTAAPGGKGRSTDPFNTLAAAQAVATTAGDIVYVFTGNNTNSGQNAGFTFQASSQQLIGEGVALQPTVTVNGVVNPVLRGAGTAPNIGNAGGNGVTVADRSGIFIRGFDITGNTNAVAVTYTAAGGGVTISNNSTITGGSQNAIDVTTSAAGGGGITISNNTISGATTEGIDINAGGTGTLTADVSTNTLNATGNAFDARTTAGALNLNFSTNTGITSAANGVDISGAGGGTLTITGFANNTVSGASGVNGIIVQNAKFDAVLGGNLDTVAGGTTVIGASGNGVGGNGLVLINTTGNLSFTDLDIFADGAFGLQVQGNGVLTATTGTGIAVGSGVGSVTTTAGRAVDIQAATIDLQQFAVTSNGGTDGVSLTSGIAGTFSSTAGSTIANASSDDFVVGSGTANITWNGVLNGSTGHTVNVTGHTGGTVAFTGSITDTGTGIQLNGNTGATINFTGGLSISTGANTAFNATGGGTVNVCDESPCNPAATGGLVNTLTTTTATALNVNATTIGANRLEFRSINAPVASGNPGIILNYDRCDGRPHRYGQQYHRGNRRYHFNKTGNGVTLISTSSVTLTNMNLTANGTAQSVPGSSSNCGGDLATGNNLSCVANAYLQTVTGATFDNLSVTSSGQQGINGNAVNGLTITNWHHHRQRRRGV